MERYTYYVTMETGQIHREPFDDQVKYYEVLASESEIHEIERLLKSCTTRNTAQMPTRVHLMKGKHRSIGINNN